YGRQRVGRAGSERRKIPRLDVIDPLKRPSEAASAICAADGWQAVGLFHVLSQVESERADHVTREGHAEGYVVDSIRTVKYCPRRAAHVVNDDIAPHTEHDDEHDERQEQPTELHSLEA